MTAVLLPHADRRVTVSVTVVNSFLLTKFQASINQIPSHIPNLSPNTTLKAQPFPATTNQPLYIYIYGNSLIATSLWSVYLPPLVSLLQYSWCEQKRGKWFVHFPSLSPECHAASLQNRPHYFYLSISPIITGLKLLVHCLVKGICSRNVQAVLYCPTKKAFLSFQPFAYSDTLSHFQQWCHNVLGKEVNKKR